MTPGAVAERATHIAMVRADALADVVAVRSAMVAAREMASWVTAQQAGLVAKLAGLESFPEASIAAATKESLGDAVKVRERADTLAVAPRLAGALDDGAITAGHVDALTRASKQIAGEDRDALLDRVDALVGVAEASSVEQFTKRIRLEVKRLQTDDGEQRLQRQRRSVRLRSWTDDDGMFCINGRFDPVTGVKLHARLDHAVQALFAKATPESCPDDPIEKQRFLTAHALVHLVTAPDSATGVARPGRAEFVVVIDADAGDYPGPVAQWPIPVEIPTRVLAQLAGQADVSAVVVRNGVVLHAPGNLNLGRSTRLANRAQRRALRGLYNGCAMPGCSVGYDYCKLHHIIWWRHGGHTDLDNLIPICTKHHSNIHNDGWTIHLGPNRQLTLRLPDGTIHNTGPPTRNTG